MKRTQTKNIRISEIEQTIMQKNADKYCSGNISEWIRLASLNWFPTKEQTKAIKTMGVK